MLTDMIQKLSSLPLIFILLYAAASCTNIKAVSTYSAGALENIKQYDSLGYSFKQACLDSCRLERYYKLQLSAADCTCESNKKADEVSRQIYTALKNYFTALSQLAGNDVTTYKTNGLATALNESGLISSTPDKKAVVNAYSKISDVLMRIITDGYRSNKLSQVIGAADGPVDTLLHYLQFIVSNDLTGKLKVKAAKLQYDIYPELMQHARSDYEKKHLIDEYDNDLSAIDTKRALLATYARALQKMAEGHHQLFLNRNRLKAKDVQDNALNCLDDLGTLLTEFEILKNAN